MSLHFTLAMARREGRSSWRRIGFYMASITLGVGALVAINSFRSDVTAAIHREARTLLGADLRLSSRRPLPDTVQSLLDSLTGAGAEASYVTSFSSMALATRTGRTRLVNVRGLEGGFPFYGEVETDPAGSWSELQSGRHALVDRSVLIYLGARVGDELRIGQASFTIAGSIVRMPGEADISAAIRPRVIIPAAYVAETELLGFGSLVRYRTYVSLTDPEGADAFAERYEALLHEEEVGTTTVAERAEDYARSLDIFARFLGLVGLAALLLGGLGVASAVHVFVKRKLETVAVLRCIGATQRTVFAVYLLQAVLMGLGGSAAGVILGLAVQALLPGILGDFLPVAVSPTLHPIVILAGLGVGVWVAVVFGLLPLLSVRDVTPLAALRRAFDGPERRWDVWRLAVIGALVATVVALSIAQAPHPWAGVAFAAAAAVTVAILGGTAWALTRATRRLFPRRAPYVVRQGVANLFRPHNQTVAVTLTVGFGVFVLGSMHIVQRNLLDRLSIDASPDRPNLVVFDVQQDQRDGVASLIEEHGFSAGELTPLIPARIAALNDRPVDELLEDTTGSPQPEHWAVRREYRHTYRDSLVGSEELVAGRWWDEPAAPGALPRISVEEDVADDLGVGLGDRITWDVQGVLIETEVTSLRRVSWARFETNFFVVFEPGVLDAAPTVYVTLTRVPGEEERAVLQRDLVEAYPNVSALDLSLVQQTIETLVGSIALAIRFMALFSIASGMIVLVAAVATSRYQRVRESVLLKTLGGQARQVRQVLATEYVALGSLAGLTGCILAGVAGWALVTFLFELSFRLPLLQLAGIGLAAAATTVLVGLVAGRDALRRAPLAVLREIGE